MYRPLNQKCSEVDSTDTSYHQILTELKYEDQMKEDDMGIAYTLYRTWKNKKKIVRIFFLKKLQIILKYRHSYIEETGL
jgi:hypothetical protein